MALILPEPSDGLCSLIRALPCRQSYPVLHERALLRSLLYLTLSCRRGPVCFCSALACRHNQVQKANTCTSDDGDWF